MKKISYVALGIFCFLVLGSLSASAQSDSKKFSVGFGLEGGLPVGDANTGYHFTGGITIRFAYHVGPGFVTLTSGAVGYIPKTDQGKSTKASLQIPVKAGYKYIFAKPFFVMGEVGFSSFKIYYDDNGTVASNSYSGFTFAPTVGVNFNAFEAGIKYESTSITGGSLSNISLRLGFNF
ncbi:MAG TPA: outer membrane beta-barrel protein [Puia sp.]|nr:outer membrane beta-barrel protein [Puia sp.]